MSASRLGLGITVTLHAIAVLGLMSYEPARNALLAAAPIMVDLITPPRTEPPKPVPAEPPRPKPVVKRVVRQIEPPPVLTAPADAPSPAVAPPPPPPAPAPAPQLVDTPPATQPARAPQVTQPVYDADYLLNPAPPYPPLSKRGGEQGRVTLRVLVNAQGAADQVEVRTSSGFLRLDESARATVLRWKFVPAKRGTEPLAAWVLIPISFRLER